MDRNVKLLGEIRKNAKIKLCMRRRMINALYEVIERKIIRSDGMAFNNTYTPKFPNY